MYLFRVLLNSYVLVKVEEHIDAQMENVSGGNRGGVSSLAPRQWRWWASGWCGCSIGWWGPPGGSSGARAARWPPWGESGSAATRPGSASCPWRRPGAPSSSQGAAPPGGAPYSGAGGETRRGREEVRGSVCVAYREQNTTSGTLLL